MKRIILGMLIVISIIFIKTDVYAAEKCTNDELRALKVEAMNLDFEYTLKDSENDPYISHYYVVSTINYSKNLDILLNDMDYAQFDDNQKEVVFSKSFFPSTRLDVTIYGSSDSVCSGELLSTRTIYIPNYNNYSEYEECKEYKDYDICKKETNTRDISKEEFYRLIQEIKDNQTPKEEKKEEKKDENVINNVIDFYQNNKIIVILISLITGILIITIIVLIIRKNKNKIKIDLGDKL